MCLFPWRIKVTAPPYAQSITMEPLCPIRPSAECSRTRGGNDIAAITLMRTPGRFAISSDHTLKAMASYAVRVHHGMPWVRPELRVAIVRGLGTPGNLRPLGVLKITPPYSTPGSGSEVSVDAPGALTGRAVVSANGAVHDSAQVPGHARDQRTCRQPTDCEVHRRAGADLQCWCPHPSCRPVGL